MLQILSVENVDQLLNELEERAHADIPYRDFVAFAIERLRFLLNAEGTAALNQSTVEHWICTISMGQFSFASELDCLPEQPTNRYLYQSAHRCLIVPTRKGNWCHGALAVQMPREISEVELKEATALCEAFAEIVAIRQLAEVERLVGRKSANMQVSLAKLAQSQSREEGAVLIVNDIAALTKADRVSLVQSRGYRSARALAISGVVRQSRNADAIVEIEKAAAGVIRTQRPLTKHSGAGNGEKKAAQPPLPAAGQDSSSHLLLANQICIPLSGFESQRRSNGNAALLLEWDDYDSFVLGGNLLTHVLPVFLAGWLQLDRWLSVPAPLRSLSSALSRLTSRRLAMSFLRAALWIGLVVLAVSLLNRPYPMRIEAEGTLQPVEQRVVYSAMDGLVSSVVVVDGQAVVAGDVLVEMQSPQLEIEIQSVLGELRANKKRLDGLNLTVNQLDGENATVLMMSEMSAEIRELESLIETQQEKHRALLTEKERLVLKSPIAGVVVAEQLERYLDARPVRRGDALLRVIDFSGPWQLDLAILDQDSGYIKRKLFADVENSSGKIAAGGAAGFEFVLASQPEKPAQGIATWMATSTRNSDANRPVVDLKASVDAKAAELGHMGATATAYFDCGEHPFWFVWSRPLVEAIQKRLWFTF